MLRVVLLVLAALPLSLASSPSFAEWVSAHGKRYSSREELVLRRSIYASNVAFIDAHNALNASWSMAVNAFSDLSGDEFKAAYTGGYRAAGARPATLFAPPKMAPPADVDWRTKGAVTAVKDQGGCGSCWAFSATGAIEGAYFISSKKLVSLSEQQVMSCDSKDGCGGGNMQSAFEWVIKNKGQCSEREYPYKAKNEPCRGNCTKEGFIKSYEGVASKDEAALVAAIAGRPVAVAIEADQASFQHYRSGVMTGACGTKLDHGVLAVGYTAEGSIIKNSWGAGWGDKGYITLARGKYNGDEGQCGVQIDPSFPVGEQ